MKDGLGRKVFHLPKQHDLLDSGQLKRAFDELAIANLHELGYSESQITTCLKIYVGIFTCGIALFAQLYPVEYPDSHDVMIAFIAGYFSLKSCVKVLFKIKLPDIAGKRADKI